MASPQVEQGYTRIADELLEALIAFNLSKRQYKVILAVIRMTYGYNRTSDVLASSQLARMTGLTDRHCRETVCQLEAIGLLRTSMTANGKLIELIKDYDLWKTPGPKQAGPKETGRPKTGRKPGPKRAANTAQNGPHNKEKIDRQITQPPQPERDIGTGGGELIFPEELTAGESDSAAQLLRTVPPDQRQAILDVLAAAIKAGEVRKSRLAVLGGLVRRCRDGTFDPAPGLHLAERRARRAARDAAHRAAEVRAIGPPPTADAVRAARERFRQLARRRSSG